MALSRISNSSGLFTPLSRISHTANASLGNVQCTRYTAVNYNRTKGLHVTSIRRYPDPPILPLPTNVSEIFANETGRFTPERSRDIAAPVLLYGKGNECKSFSSEQSSKSSIPATCRDTHVDSYDCFGAVSLNGTMQSNVPKPFCSSGKSTHLNMPGGQWARDGKYIAEDMQKSHYRSVSLPKLKLDVGGSTTNILLRTVYGPNYIFSMGYSMNTTQKEQKASDERKKILSIKKQRFKRIVKDYGVTIIVFHIGISLINLGAFYIAIASGLDLSSSVKNFLSIKNEVFENIIDNSSNFLLAYALHKLFAPIRISITIAVAPLLVRYLRKVGILKPPKVKTTELR